VDIGDLERIAAACRIDTSILRLIVRRFVDEMTIPAKLVALLAEATGAQIKDVWSFLTAVPTVATADYFAPAGRRSGSRISFAEAIRNPSVQNRHEGPLPGAGPSSEQTGPVFVSGRRASSPRSAFAAKPTCYALVSRQGRVDVRQASAATPMARP
jgi:hypothetical protein